MPLHARKPYPKPWLQHTRGSDGERSPKNFSSEKTESQTRGEMRCKKNGVPTFRGLCFFQSWKKTESTKSKDSNFFHSISPHVWDSVCFRAEIFGLLFPSLPLVCWSQGLMTLGNSLGQIFPDNHCGLFTVYTKVSAPYLLRFGCNGVLKVWTFRYGFPSF